MILLSFFGARAYKSRLIRIYLMLCLCYRRGGEPARLKLSQYKEAVVGEWLDKERVHSLNLTPLEERLMHSTKITYMVGKGNKLVPVIFPTDVLKGLGMLSNSLVRQKVNVLPSNPYLFPSTRMSEFHLSGWHGFFEICQSVNLIKPQNVTYTKNRHLISTIYSAMELPNEERSGFYEHMGHTASMNKERYQCPPALRELTKIGKVLHTIDRGTHLFL